MAITARPMNPEDDDVRARASTRASSRRSRCPRPPIHETVLAGAAERGDHPALVDGVTGQTITYAQLAQMVDRMAAGFAEIGVRPGDVVALHSPNTVLYPVVFYAASRAGATVTTLSALATRRRTWPTSSTTQGARWSSRSARCCRWRSRRPATGRCGPATGSRATAACRTCSRRPGRCPTSSRRRRGRRRPALLQRGPPACPRA